MTTEPEAACGILYLDKSFPQVFVISVSAQDGRRLASNKTKNLYDALSFLRSFIDRISMFRRIGKHSIWNKSRIETNFKYEDLNDRKTGTEQESNNGTSHD